MKALVDPEEAEVRHLLAACPLPSKRVLEIGCGRGILTWKYVGLPEQVIAIDPDEGSLREAAGKRPEPSPNVQFIKAKGQALPFPSKYFDTVFYTSSF